MLRAVLPQKIARTVDSLPHVVALMLLLPLPTEGAKSREILAPEILRGEQQAHQRRQESTKHPRCTICKIEKYMPSGTHASGTIISSARGQLFFAVE